VSALQTPTPLDETTGTTRAWHCWSPEEVMAVIQAWASERPLLIRGEAGCGKSQLARAVAQLLAVPFITEVIHPRYEATDLLYRDDPVRRLAHAQLLSVACPADQQDRLAWLNQQLDPQNFVTPGPLWQAMAAPDPTGCPAAWPRAVVLIDEIDKADSDLPNALLGVLGDRSFKVHPTGQNVPCPTTHRPLVLITTNEDRELPAAFVRRCAVLNLQPPKDDRPDAFVAWLMARAQVHEPLQALRAEGSEVLKTAALQVWADRREASRNALPTVGLAEYLDLLHSLHRLSGADPARAAELLNQLAPYALVKHRDQDQRREPHSTPSA
jgi:MoxR-like ATPase